MEGRGWEEREEVVEKMEGCERMNLSLRNIACVNGICAMTKIVGLANADTR